jgi:hydroxymethylpyrimidine/phosphomethylpyrimidine kinase
VNAKGRVLIVAGSDSGGGAGIQADLKTVAAFGGYGMTAVTALTAQNTLGVHGLEPVRPEFVGQQMRVVLEDIGADVIKIGMLVNAGVADAVAEVLTSALVTSIPVVLDTVMTATRGGSLLDSGGVAVLKGRLLRRAMILTPNIPEAEMLTGLEIRDLDGMRRAANALLGMGAPNVLLKGGHLEGDALIDLLVGGEGETIFRHGRIASRQTHGTGCVLSSAIAVRLAQGAKLANATADACAYVQAAIRAAPGLGRGNGPLGFPPPPGNAVDDTA